MKPDFQTPVCVCLDLCIDLTCDSIWCNPGNSLQFLSQGANLVCTRNRANSPPLIQLPGLMATPAPFRAASKKAGRRLWERAPRVALGVRLLTLGKWLSPLEEAHMALISKSVSLPREALCCGLHRSLRLVWHPWDSASVPTPSPRTSAP